MCNSVYECTWGSNTWTCKIQLLIGVKNYYDNMSTDVEFLAILFPVQPEHIATHTSSSLAFFFSVAGNFSQRINLQEEECPGRLKRTIRSQNWRTFLLAVTEGVTVNTTKISYLLLPKYLPTSASLIDERFSWTRGSACGLLSGQTDFKVHLKPASASQNLGCDYLREFLVLCSSNTSALV